MIDGWRDDAECRADPDAWYTEGQNSRPALAAKRICLDCPVRRECAENAVASDESWGIRAGYHTHYWSDWLALHAYLEVPAPTRKGGRVVREKRRREQIARAS